MSEDSLRGRACLAVLTAIAAPVFSAQEYKTTIAPSHPAIEYGERPVDDRVHRLSLAIQRGQTVLRPQRDAGAYVPQVLELLNVSTDSQWLVFSKTSLQAAHISPARPRAIYFTDDVVVAHVPGAPAIELAAIDRVQGPVFYAMSTDAQGKPSFARSTACLRCHQGPNTEGVPGIYVGSVIPGPAGAPLRDDSAIITDHRTPFRDRWGGWYVTAKRGQQRDRANAVASNPADPQALVQESQHNLLSLAGRFNGKDYLAGTSDIVALMAFEHQTQMTNLITRVGWEARSGQTLSSVEDLVAYMLFSDEAPLTESIEGVSSFTRTFAARGVRDRRGRSLRDLDLRTRLFRYPLSYMIYTEAFDALPDATRDTIYRRLHDILTGSGGPAYAHLSVVDRRAILEIVRDTKAGLPAYWLSAS